MLVYFSVLKNLRRALLLACCSLVIFACKSGGESSSFFVEGACDSCKVIIESTLLEQEGVLSAQWDVNFSQAKVRFNPGKTDPEQLQSALSERGFVTQYFDPNENARQSLPACCRKALNKKIIETDTIHGK